VGVLAQVRRADRGTAICLLAYLCLAVAVAAQRQHDAASGPDTRRERSFPETGRASDRQSAAAPVIRERKRPAVVSTNGRPPAGVPGLSA